ncbi:MAG: deoxyribodipyrimidine photo-lyase [Candidatus Nanopelagicales bacterium]
MWFRRDLRLSDNPALLEAIRAGSDGVLALFVVDPKSWNHAGPAHQAYLVSAIRSLQASLSGNLQIVHGDPADVVTRSAVSLGAQSVHVAADYTPYGNHRDLLTEASLRAAGVKFVRTGSPYAVAPGQVNKGDHTGYRVFTPYFRTWLAHGWRSPANHPTDMNLLTLDTFEELPTAPDTTLLQLPKSGEAAALDRWQHFLTEGIHDYAKNRNRPDLSGTSRMSIALRFGEIHPRTLLADLGETKDQAVYRKELAWREFYADVLYRSPASADQYLRPEFATMQYDSGALAEERLKAWQSGCTGYPMVDAGMRQLLAEGWMHNRVRMLVASFLVKDLHLEWQVGARWFMQHLIDGDLASNSHGWQWTAGCGTDAAPYYRIFNPVTNGLRFDPDGRYVHRFVPDLRHLSGQSVHEPWNVDDGYTGGYPSRIVDHADERAVSLQRYQAMKAD